MPFRSWLYVAALGLIALGGSLQAQEQSDGGQNGTGAEHQPSQPLPPALPVRIIEDDESARSRQTAEAESRQREIDDLVAQQGVNAATQTINEATQSMKRAAWVSTGLGVLGAFLLALTLHLTREATRAAREGTNAAREAIAVTRKIGEAQVRAYVSADAIQVTNVFAGQVPVTEIVITNNGQSPAYRVKVISAFNYHIGDPDDRMMQQSGPRRAPLSTLGKTPISISGKFVRAVEPSEIERIASNEVTVCIAGALIYQDVFGKTRRTVFRSVQQSFDKLTGVVDLRIAKRQNHSN